MFCLLERKKYFYFGFWVGICFGFDDVGNFSNNYIWKSRECRGLCLRFIFFGFLMVWFLFVICKSYDVCKWCVCWCFFFYLVWEKWNGDFGEYFFWDRCFVIREKVENSGDFGFKYSLRYVFGWNCC